MTRSLVAGGALVLLASLASSAAASQVSSDTLGEGLDSLRIAQVDPKAPKVSYMPAKIQISDATGGAQARLEAVPFGSGQALISGRLSIVIDPEDVAKLENRARAAYGGQTQITRVAPRAFGVWLFLNGEEVWRRGTAGGQIERIPVQATVKSQAQGQSVEADAVALLAWGEVVPPVQAKATLDWKAVAERVRRRAESKGILTRRALEEVIESSMAAGQIRVDSENVAPADSIGMRERVKQMLAAQVARILLEDPRPIPAQRNQPASKSTDTDTKPSDRPKIDGGSDDSTFSIAYTVKKNVETGTESAVIDLGTSSYVERSAVVRQKVSIKF